MRYNKQNALRLIAFLLLFSAMQLSMADSFPTSAAAKDFTDKVMAKVATGDIQGGLEMMKPYTIVPSAEFDAMVGQAALQLPTITQRFGKSLGQEFIGEARVGESLVRLIYISRYERHAMRWRFFLYKGGSGWVINTFLFDDRIHEIFPQ